ncbi:dipeptide ABC transporter ATP-binding protein [Pseudogracilibacillus sp. SO30301A]
MEQPLLHAKNIKKYFPIKGGILKRTIGQLKAVDDISFHVYEGETLGVVGESGSGKSTLGRVLLRLLDPTAGQIIFNSVDISTMANREIRPFRKDMQIIFQDPFASLNSKMSVEELIEEPLVIQQQLPKSERRKRVIDMLEKVGLRASDRLKYPHEFSGGQRQRISIARALIMEPKFVICDEPVSALDVSIQSQVLNLMKDLQDDLGLTYLFIAHDLSVIKHISDRVAVMYLGRFVELTSKEKIYENPLHPYTQALLSAVPVIGIDDEEPNRDKIILKGDLPNPADPPTGCAFRTRCPHAFDRCAVERPNLVEIEKDHLVACHLYS